MDKQEFNVLIKRFKHDENAFNKIIKYYYPRIVHRITRVFGDYELAKDAAQEFFGIRIFNAKIPDCIESPMSWIYVSCKNAAIDLLTEKNDGLKKF